MSQFPRYANNTMIYTKLVARLAEMSLMYVQSL